MKRHITEYKVKVTLPKDGTPNAEAPAESIRESRASRRSVQSAVYTGEKSGITPFGLELDRRGHIAMSRILEMYGSE